MNIEQDLKKIIGSIIEDLKPLFNSLINVFNQAWQSINDNEIFKFLKMYEESKYIRIKKGNRYLKFRRHNYEDISKSFSRKVRYYQKKVQ